jgi:hypothetical protein
LVDLVFVSFSFRFRFVFDCPGYGSPLCGERRHPTHDLTHAQLHSGSRDIVMMSLAALAAPAAGVAVAATAAPRRAVPRHASSCNTRCNNEGTRATAAVRGVALQAAGVGDDTSRRRFAFHSFCAATTAAALVAAPPPADAVGQQPIDWLFQETFGSVGKVGSTLAEAVNSGGGDRGGGGGGGVGADAGAAGDGQEEKGGGLDAGTAVKFGKFGAILVFADVVTFAVLGRSVLGGGSPSSTFQLNLSRF